MLARIFQMWQKLSDYFGWMPKHSTQEARPEELNRCRWKNGCICPKCVHDKSFRLKLHHLYECDKCGCRVSPTAGMVFERTCMQLLKWFPTTNLMSADKRGISVERISKMAGDTWPIVGRVLRKLSQSMGDRARGCWRDLLVEVGDAYFALLGLVESHRRQPEVTLFEKCGGRDSEGSYRMHRWNILTSLFFAFNRQFRAHQMLDQLLNTTVNHALIRAFRIYN